MFILFQIFPFCSLHVFFCFCFSVLRVKTTQFIIEIKLSYKAERSYNLAFSVIFFAVRNHQAQCSNFKL